MRPLHELTDLEARWSGVASWKRKYRLTREREPYATLQWETASGSLVCARTATAVWTFERPGGTSPSIRVREADGCRELAEFVADWREGGRLTLCTGRRWHWRPEVASLDRWSFRDPFGRVGAEFQVESVGLSPTGRVRSPALGGDVPEGCLLVLLGWYLFVSTLDDGSLLPMSAPLAVAP